MAQSILVVGAHARLYLNNTPYGRVADYSWTEETPQKPTQVVDYLPPWELVPGAVQVHVQMTVYKARRDGGIEGAGLKSTWAGMPLQKYFSALLLDRVADTVLFRADRCAVTSQQWTVHRGYVMGAVTFTALLWGNEQPDPAA